MRPFLAALLVLAACGHVTAPSSEPDATPAGEDSAAAGDRDSSILGSTDAGPCTPSWCGCGSCDPADIVCSHTDHPCPLDCVGRCPTLASATCTAVYGGCVRAGVDAGATRCYADDDCPVPGMCCPRDGGHSYCSPRVAEGCNF